jgi:hypothetical protein
MTSAEPSQAVVIRGLPPLVGEGFLRRSEDHRQRPHELARSLDPRVRVPRVIRVASSRTPTATVPNNVRPVRQDGRARYYHAQRAPLQFPRCGYCRTAIAGRPSPAGHGHLPPGVTLPRLDNGRLCVHNAAVPPHACDRDYGSYSPSLALLPIKGMLSHSARIIECRELHTDGIGGG